MNDWSIRCYYRFFAAAFSLVCFGLRSSVAEDLTSLFDGKTLQGWETVDNDKKWWTVSDNLITGGSLEQTVPHNTFLATTESFENFDLTLKIRIRGGGGFINSGVQMRSVRVPGNSEMSGYQVDAGEGWWGKMYDESRRNVVIAEAANLGAVNDGIRKDDWNEFRVLAEGLRIRSWINGIPAVDYTESDPNIARDGHIGIQVHGGGMALIQVKDVTIKRLPASEGALTWERLRDTKSLAEPWSPEEEQQGFQVPDGFDVELVAAESDGIGKFVAVAFDAGGRMWTMTALEYPVDANENPEGSRALFAQGGKDKVLVFDQPFGKVASKPRVFADGLVMPLGVLPYKDGAFIQYGNDIRFYRDTDGDGKADSHDVVLTGFGTQDSHLFPHQFTRTPGGYILTAQGLFNDSTVRRPDGSPFANGENAIPFKQCKLGRFTPSGSEFEALTAGPNNIWGLTISREGETWLQEANDLGYPIIPYEPGGYYATGSGDRLQPYQPLMPAPLGPPQMGGTGLSGLALADDRDGWPAPWGSRDAEPNSSKLFYVANPITSRIQIIKATFDGKRYVYEKQSDFLKSQDPKFRPVAIQFGPDGCLYVTDWYNKIISHNEVPRNHPERDKIRGRIWRIRHKGQPYAAPLNLKSLASEELITQLGAANAKNADVAWQEIVDRGAKELSSQLVNIAADESLPADRRLGALWALEGLQTVPTPLLQSLAKSSHANIRHEAARVAAAQPRSSAEYLSIVGPLIEDPSPKVRAAVGDGLRRIKNPDSAVVGLMMRLGKASTNGDPFDVYDREFERFLARWAMERNAATVQTFLDSTDGKLMPLENRLLATLALEGKASAERLASLLPDLKRPLTEEEIRSLVAHVNEPLVDAAISKLLQNPATREATLRLFSALRTKMNTTAVAPAIDAATLAHWKEADSDAAKEFAMDIAGEFSLVSLDQPIAAYAASAKTPEAMKLVALRTLQEIGSTQYDVLADIVSNDSEPRVVRDSALAALSSSTSPEAGAVVADLLTDLNFEQRKLAIERMATNRSGAVTLLSAVDKGNIEVEDISPATLQAMQALLPDSELLKELWGELAEKLKPVVVLRGGNGDFLDTPIDLVGPFTIETLVRLNPGIDNSDGILARANVVDMNFFAEQFRVYLFGSGDIAVARRKILPNVWTHVAVTRDDLGVFRIYVSGELDSQSKAGYTVPLTDLRIGLTTPPNSGTSGFFDETRVWRVARSASEIRDNFDRSFAGEKLPADIVHYFHDREWGLLSGNAMVEPTLDAPTLLTAEDAKKQFEKFVKYRELAKLSGDAGSGKIIFKNTCLTCHQQGGKGGNIGPALDGVGLTGTEALLRNLLTPSAAMEGGYRSYQILTRSGRIVQGLFVTQDIEAIVIRQPGLADQRIPKNDIERAGFTSTSVMPTGLLESMRPEQVSDLFSYLLSLR